MADKKYTPPSLNVKNPLISNVFTSLPFEELTQGVQLVPPPKENDNLLTKGIAGEVDSFLGQDEAELEPVPFLIGSDPLSLNPPPRQITEPPKDPSRPPGDPLQAKAGGDHGKCPTAPHLPLTPPLSVGVGDSTLYESFNQIPLENTVPLYNPSDFNNSLLTQTKKPLHSHLAATTATLDPITVPPPVSRASPTNLPPPPPFNPAVSNLTKSISTCSPSLVIHPGPSINSPSSTSLFSSQYSNTSPIVSFPHSTSEVGFSGETSVADSPSAPISEVAENKETASNFNPSVTLKENTSLPSHNSFFNSNLTPSKSTSFVSNFQTSNLHHPFLSRKYPSQTNLPLSSSSESNQNKSLPSISPFPPPSTIPSSFFSPPVSSTSLNIFSEAPPSFITEKQSDFNIIEPPQDPPESKSIASSSGIIPKFFSPLQSYFSSAVSSKPEVQGVSDNSVSVEPSTSLNFPDQVTESLRTPSNNPPLTVLANSESQLHDLRCSPLSNAPIVTSHNLQSSSAATPVKSESVSPLPPPPLKGFQTASSSPFSLANQRKAIVGSSIQNNTQSLFTPSSNPAPVPFVPSTTLESTSHPFASSQSISQSTSGTLPVSQNTLPDLSHSPFHPLSLSSSSLIPSPSTAFTPITSQGSAKKFFDGNLSDDSLKGNSGSGLEVNSLSVSVSAPETKEGITVSSENLQTTPFISSSFYSSKESQPAVKLPTALTDPQSALPPEHSASSDSRLTSIFSPSSSSFSVPLQTLDSVSSPHSTGISLSSSQTFNRISTPPSASIISSLPSSSSISPSRSSSVSATPELINTSVPLVYDCASTQAALSKISSTSKLGSVSSSSELNNVSDITESNSASPPSLSSVSLPSAINSSTFPFASNNFTAPSTSSSVITSPHTQSSSFSPPVVSNTINPPTPSNFTVSSSITDPSPPSAFSKSSFFSPPYLVSGVPTPLVSNSTSDSPVSNSISAPPVASSVFAPPASTNFPAPSASNIFPPPLSNPGISVCPSSSSNTFSPPSSNNAVPPTPSAFFPPPISSSIFPTSPSSISLPSASSSIFSPPSLSDNLPPSCSSNVFSPSKSTNDFPPSLSSNNITPASNAFPPLTLERQELNKKPATSPPKTQFNSTYRLSNLKRPTYAPVPDLGVSARNFSSTMSDSQIAPAHQEVLKPAVVHTDNTTNSNAPPRIGDSPPPVPPSFTAMAHGQVYRPVYHHWFFKKGGETRTSWMPFSMADSLNLEQEFTSNEVNNETIVATDGGRYDVEVLARSKVAVYWEEPPCEVRRCSWFVRGPVDSRYIPYDENISNLLEEEYKLACTKNEWNRRVELADGEVIIIYSPNAIAHHQRSSSPDPWGNPPPMQQKPRVVKRGLDEFDIPEGEPTQVDHLLLIVHGIGKVCDLRFRSLVEVVDDFRTISVALVQSHYKTGVETGKVGRVEVLPVEWHRALHTEAIDQRLADITLPSIPRARQFTNETLLDILFYTSPVFCERIVQAVGAELNRVFSLYMKRNPDYKGGVSLGGHSLGSLILFDMLCHQKPAHKLLRSPSVSFEEGDEDVSSLGCLKTRARLSRKMSYLTIGSAGTGQPFIDYPQLMFQPRSFFALGSPIGMFVTVRGIESLGEDFKFPTCPSFFNIFHPNDPVAYRIEGLISPDMANHPAVLIPHHKGRKRMHLELKETMVHVTAALKQKLMESVRSTWNTFYQLAMFHKHDEKSIENEVDKVIQDEMHVKESQEDESSEGEAAGLDLKVGKLNGGRRIDYVLQEAPLETFNQYISAIRSHVVYWESEDTSLMILKEIYEAKGITTDSQVVQPILPFDLSPEENADPGTAYEHFTVSPNLPPSIQESFSRQSTITE